MSVHIPQISAEVHADGTGVLHMDGTEHHVHAGDTTQVRQEVLRRITERAAADGHELPVTTIDPDGRNWRLIIGPDGSVTPAPEPVTESTDEPPTQDTPSDDAPANTPAPAENEPDTEDETPDEDPPVQATAAPVPGSAPVLAHMNTPPPPTPGQARQPDVAPQVPSEKPDAQRALAPTQEPAAGGTPADQRATQRPTAAARVAPPMDHRPHIVPSSQPAPSARSWFGAPVSPETRVSPSASNPSTLTRAAPPTPPMSGAAAAPGEADTADSPSQVWDQVISDHNRSVQPVLVVLSCKGGVGKTTTTVGVGAALAIQRGERVLALDANHFGNLASRLADTSGATLADLARDSSTVQDRGFASMRYYLGYNGHGLHALASGRSPDGGAAEYEAAAGLAEHYADAVLTDCGTDLERDPTLVAAVTRSNRAIIVTDPSTEAVMAAEQTLTWLSHHHPALANSAVVALCQRTPRGPRPASVEQRLGVHGNPVITIPFDRHLAKGGVIDQRRLRRPTRTAYAELAMAAVMQ